MEQRISLPDGLASDVTRFAGENDIPQDRAYELLVTVGLEALDGVAMEVDLEDGRLVLECPACGVLFESPEGAFPHDCEGT